MPGVRGLLHVSLRCGTLGRDTGGGPGSLAVGYLLGGECSAEDRGYSWIRAVRLLLISPGAASLCPDRSGDVGSGSSSRLFRDGDCDGDCAMAVHSRVLAEVPAVWQMMKKRSISSKCWEMSCTMSQAMDG